LTPQQLPASKKNTPGEIFGYILEIFFGR